MTLSLIGKLLISNLSEIDFPILKGLSSTLPNFMKASKFAQFHIKTELFPITK